MALRLYLGEQDVMHLVASVTVSGSLTDCCRTLRAELAASFYDFRLPAAQSELGSLVRFYDGDTLLFYGSLFTVKLTTNGSTKSLVAFDMGYFLKHNVGTYSFRGQAPDAITARVCREYWVPVASLAVTGKTVTRKFQGVALDKIIDTVYTLGGTDKYLTRFTGAALNVIVKGEPKSATVIEGTANLQNMTYSYSSDGMVNSVKGYDKDGNLLLTRANADNPAATYGLRTKILTQREGEDIDKQIRDLFEDNDIERKITVSVLAANDMITGNAVYLIEPFTGQKGLFWIDEDSHTWKNGLHTANLTLNFRNIMREGESGTEED